MGPSGMSEPHPRRVRHSLFGRPPGAVRLRGCRAESGLHCQRSVTIRPQPWRPPRAIAKIRLGGTPAVGAWHRPEARENERRGVEIAFNAARLEARPDEPKSRHPLRPTDPTFAAPPVTES